MLSKRNQTTKVFAAIRLILAICFVAAGANYLLGGWGGQQWQCADSLFFGTWTLGEFQAYFTGEIPKDATEIDYFCDPVYGLLSFKAPPASAVEFADRFCYGFRYQGYDPFSATDDEEPKGGFLIRTERSHYYYSHSPNPPSTIYGNRCFDFKRGGLHQILVDQSNPDIYIVKLDISSVCTHPSENHEHKCDGHPIEFENQGFLTADMPTRHIKSQYATGHQWEVFVSPGDNYEITINLIESAEKSTYGNQFHLSVLPQYQANAPSCEACWITLIGSRSGNLRATFTGAPSSKSYIKVFWMGDPATYTIQVRKL